MCHTSSYGLTRRYSGYIVVVRKKWMQTPFSSKAGRTVGELKKGGLWREERINRYVTKADPHDDHCWVPTIQERSRLFLIVAGGRPGATAGVMHGWNETTRGVSVSFDA